MKKNKDFHDWISDFFCGYLTVKRNYSDKTVKSYKDTFNLLRKYFDSELGIKFININFENCNKENIYSFLLYLRDEKSNSASTINLRLSAIKSFFKYCGEEEIELYKYYTKIKTIHNFKGSKKNKVEYLTSQQLKLLFEAPDIGLKKGRRDRFLMILMYETGMRLNEILSLKLENIIPNGEDIEIKIFGKGSKYRTVPLLKPAIKHLNAYLKEFHPLNNQSDYLFYVNHSGRRDKLSPGTVDAFLKKYAHKINEESDDFPINLHAHMLRHSVAMSMYKNGIPISYVKDFLGHSDISTTSIYAYADNEDIKKALEAVQKNIPSSNVKEKKWRGKEKDLLKYCGLE